MIGVILAGGASRRLGTPKHALVLGDGRTMIEWVAAALAACCDRIVVAGVAAGAGHDLPGGFEIIPDTRPGLGPLAGIEAVLGAGLGTRHLFCPCDLPLLGAGLIAALAAPSGRPVTLLRVEGEDTPRPLPAVIDAVVLPQVTAALDGERLAVRGLWAEIDTAVVTVPADLAAQLLNVNTPEDYETLRAASVSPPG